MWAGANGKHWKFGITDAETIVNGESRIGNRRQGIGNRERGIVNEKPKAPLKDSESDGVRYFFQRSDETVVPLVIDVQDGIPDGPLGIVDLSFHIDAAIREHSVYGQQHAGNVPVNVRQPVVLWGARELTVWQIHAEHGVAAL